MIKFTCYKISLFSSETEQTAAVVFAMSYLGQSSQVLTTEHSDFKIQYTIYDYLVIYIISIFAKDNLESNFIIYPNQGAFLI